MHFWLYNRTAEDYAISADWDDCWRTGGNLVEVIEEAHLSQDWPWMVLAVLSKTAGNAWMRPKPEII